MPNDFNNNDSNNEDVDADPFARAVDCVKKMEPARRSPEALSRALGVAIGTVLAMWPRLIRLGLVESRDGGRAPKSAPGVNPPVTAGDVPKTRPIATAATPVAQTTSTTVPAESAGRPDVASVAAAPVTRTRVRVRLADLVPHPAQGTYDAVPDGRERAFRDDVARRGLDHPIETYPPVIINGRRVYPMLDGCRRKAALEARGDADTVVVVRHDLPDYTSPAGTVAFLKANFERRQLDMVAQMRVAVRIVELERHGGKRMSVSQLNKVRDEIGRMLDITGRTVSRYLRLSRTPLPVQRAVSKGLLRLVTAERVADLPEREQEAIAAAIAAIEDKAEVRRAVDEGLNRGGDDAPAEGHQHIKANDAAAALIRSVERGLGDVAGREGEVGAKFLARHRETLRRGLALFESWVAIADGAATATATSKPPSTPAVQKRPPRVRQARARLTAWDA